MQPKLPPDTRPQPDLFRSRLENMLNRRHPLYVEKVGRPGLPILLLVGLHFLKHAFGESDESVVERFVENPYWQYFCGFEYFQHTFPVDTYLAGAVAQADQTGRDGEAAAGDDRHGAAGRSSAKKRHGACERGHDGSGEGDRLPHGRAVIPQDARGAGDGGPSRGDRTSSELRAGEKAGAAYERPVRSCPAAEAFETGDEAASDIPGPCDAGHLSTGIQY